MKNLICHILAVAIMLQSVAVPAARAAAVVQNPTRVAASRANIGGTECEQIYAGCMDQFCTSGNENAGRCLCSNDFQRIDEEWTRLGAAEIELANLTARAVEDIEAGAAAEINRAATPRTPAPSRARASQAAALALFNEHSREADPNDISNLTGAARLAAADRMCRPRLPANCNLALTRTWYQQTLRSDCRAYELVVENRRRQGAAQERLARQSIRDAAAASFEHANRFNSGDCLMNFMECMREDTACGRTWENCLHGRLAQNRMKCEHILDQCINVREFVWTNFVRLATPEIETAQVIAASDMRQSCLRDVSNCIGRACADMIGTGGDISFASCMVNPTAIQARCRVQLDRCRDIPGIFDLAARRWDAMQESACQNEVRRCFQRDDACGENWSKCVGLDLPAMHRMCPPDRLVICSRAQPGFNIQDLNDILMGIYLALDNAALEHCNNAVNRRMMEICGSLGMCDQFARLPGFGAESLRRERLGRTNIEGVTGMVSWDLVGISAGEEWSACMTRGGRNCDRLQRPGTLLINEYLQEFDQVNDGNIGYVAAARARIRSEMETVQRDIENAIILMNNDPVVAQCVGGRALAQITGRQGDYSEGRFPLMSNAYRISIARAALTQAAMNQSRRTEQLRGEILRGADSMNAQFRCYTIPIDVERQLIANNIWPGMPTSMPAQPNIRELILDSTEQPFKTSIQVSRAVSAQDIAVLAGRRSVNAIGNTQLTMQYEVWTAWNESERVCKSCTVIKTCGTEVRTSGNARLHETLRTIAVSCAIGMVTAGVSSAVKAVRSGTQAVETAANVADVTTTVVGETVVVPIQGPVTQSMAEAGQMTLGSMTTLPEVVVTATPLTEAGAQAVTQATTEAATQAATRSTLSLSNLTREVGSNLVDGAGAAWDAWTTPVQWANAAPATTGVVSGTEGALGRSSTVGEDMAWAVGQAALGVGVGAACGAMAKAFPIGTIVALAITVIAAIGAGFTSVTTITTDSCEILLEECEDLQF